MSCASSAFLPRGLDEIEPTEMCNYCQQNGGVPIEALWKLARSVLLERFEWNRSDDDSEAVAGGAGLPLDTHEALAELKFNWPDELLDDVACEIDNDRRRWIHSGQGYGWMTRGRVARALNFQWDHFAQAVKHETRYHFASTPDGPGSVLEELGRVVTTLECIREMRLVPIYRARVRHRGETWQPMATELGAPPSHKAKTGRMNPAGIAYFYGALSASTAMAEVTETPADEFEVATFELTRTVLILNLVNLPSSMLFNRNSSKRHLDDLIQFLNAFVQKIQVPVQKDGRELIDYVPTQVVSEWFAQVFTDSEGRRLDGIYYRSAICEGSNIVFFPTQRSQKGAFDFLEFKSSQAVSSRT